MRILQADLICPVASSPLEKGKLIIDEDGTIIDIVASDQGPDATEYFEGTLIPGFVNTHCHLELSHMKDVIPTGTGLINFIKNVVSKRGFAEEIIQQAIIAGDREMWVNGIMAVGDISNKTDSFKTKLKSPVRYHTFVEYFDLIDQAQTAHFTEQYDAVYAEAPNNGFHLRTAVPHAPYTMTEQLFETVVAKNTDRHIVSIHNQETPPENELFLTKTGEFVSFYDSFSDVMTSFPVYGTRSINYALKFLKGQDSVLMVHNTMTDATDIEAAHNAIGKVYWCTCPNANLYIENRLPDYNIFLAQGCTMTVGTDSLTSNWQLSILEELKTIERHFPNISAHELLQWGTLNGAQALGFGKELGSFEKGKKPGIILLENSLPDGRLSFLHAGVIRIL